MRHLILTAGLLVTAVPAFAQNVPTRTLSKADAEFPEPFTQVTGVRELKDGRVIVIDPRDKTVQALDLKAGTAVKLGREGSGPGEYGMPFRLLRCLTTRPPWSTCSTTACCSSTLTRRLAASST
jgi:hypothetical protein